MTLKENWLMLIHKLKNMWQLDRNAEFSREGKDSVKGIFVRCPLGQAVFTTKQVLIIGLIPNPEYWLPITSVGKNYFLININRAKE